MKKVLILLLVCFSFQLAAQPQLLPSIGLNSLPGDNDSICYIPFYLGSFYNSGLEEGDTVPDFKLYNLNGDSVILSSVLASGKPVLLVAGSYTCPVYRNKLLSLHNIASQYGNQVEVMIIYTIEAHPDIDTSVYFGYVNTSAPNFSYGILYRQPVTYGQRKSVAIDMISDLGITVPVYIDGPCNEWWSTFGPAPNNAYLIDTNGVVFAKHGWYDKYPDNMACDIDSLLGITGNCNTSANSGTFTFSLTSNDTVTGPAGSTITLSGLLSNPTNQDVVVEMSRFVNNMPVGWASSLCVDVCYPSSTNYALIQLPANTSEPFYFYIYTTSTLDTAFARVGFRNTVDTTNKTYANMVGITSALTSAYTYVIPVTSVNVFPLPASSIFTVQMSATKITEAEIQIYDLTSRLVLKQKLGRLMPGMNSYELNCSELDAGSYLLRVISDNKLISTKKILISR